MEGDIREHRKQAPETENWQPTTPQKRHREEYPVVGEDLVYREQWAFSSLPVPLEALLSKDKLTWTLKEKMKPWASNDSNSDAKIILEKVGN